MEEKARPAPAKYLLKGIDPLPERALYLHLQTSNFTLHGKKENNGDICPRLWQLGIGQVAAHVCRSIGRMPGGTGGHVPARRAGKHRVRVAVGGAGDARLAVLRHGCHAGAVRAGAPRFCPGAIRPHRGLRGQEAGHRHERARARHRLRQRGTVRGGGQTMHRRAGHGH